MTNEEIKSLWAKAACYARSKGLHNDAEDFAQEACIAYVRRGNIRLSSLFIDYLRQQYGRSSKRGYTPKFYERLRYTSINEPTEDEPRTPFYQPTGDIGRQPESERSDWRTRIDLQGNESIIFDLVVMKGWDRRFLAETCGVHESTISLQMREIELKTKDAILIQDTWDRYHDDKEYSKLEIDWITI